MASYDKLSLVENVDVRHKVVKAMDRLLGETPIDKLTVNAICKEAGMSRSAFYRYFDDKYAVAQWHMRYVHSQGVDEIGRTLTWYEGYYRSEIGFAWYKNFYLQASKTSDFNSIDKTAPRYRVETLTETITKYHRKKMTPKLEFEVEALAAMEVAMLPWLKVDGEEVSIEEKCCWMVDIVPKDLFELLNTPVAS